MSKITPTTPKVKKEIIHNHLHNQSTSPQVRQILIASNSLYAGLVAPIKKQLENRFEVIHFLSDKIAKGERTLSMPVTSDDKPIIIYDGLSIDLTNLAAVWYWRPNEFQIPSDDLAKQESLGTEYKGLQSFLWENITAAHYLNDPAAMQRANNKPMQLSTARQLGFRVPETRISNSWDDILELPGDEFVFKMVESILRTRDGMKILYTKKLRRAQLPLASNPYPGIWQEFIPKKREWRVTVVGSQVFAASIHTTEIASNDWREHQTDSQKVHFKIESFPEEEKKRCVALLKHYGLRYGAFDFIETINGDIYFLEINPNGQFGWLEKYFEGAISTAIASELAIIADTH